MNEKVVVAFSGGLDTSWCVPWLKETLGADVTTVCVDVGGQGADAAKRMEAQSRALGASRHVHVDARDRYFDEVLRYLIMGNVLRGNLYPLCVGAERSLQASETARVAAELGATRIAHGCTAAGNDQVRFEIALRVLAPDCEIIAPIRDLAPSREDEVAFLKERGLPVPSFGAAYSVNAGLWGVTIGGKETTGTTQSIPEDAWVWTRGAFDAPREPRRLTISFHRGAPGWLDGKGMDEVTLIEELNKLAGEFGIGRGIHLGETVLGMKGRVAFEAPAATVLIAAHRELEKLTLTGRQIQVKDAVSQYYGQYVHEGLHLEPVCRDIERLLFSSQERVSGSVRLLLRQGSFFVEGVTSPFSLRDASKSVYGESVGEWTPADAKGFCRLAGLPAILHARAGQAADRGGS